MHTCRSLLTLLVVAAVTVSAQAEAPEFYAYCVELAVPGVQPRPLAEQAAMLRDLSYAGVGLALDDNLASNLKILDDARLPLYLVWTSVNVNPAQGPAFPPQVADAMGKLKGRPVTVSVLLSGLQAGDPQGMEPAIRALRTLGDVAAQAGLRISIYNHVSNWTESLPFIIEVVRKTDHPQVGYNFNLCHWLKVHGADDYRAVLGQLPDKLFVVTINGATVVAEAWTNGLIRPLDEGDFDNGALRQRSTSSATAARLA